MSFALEAAIQQINHQPLHDVIIGEIAKTK
jgi:hypothetical protein